MRATKKISCAEIFVENRDFVEYDAEICIDSLNNLNFKF
jgi:hypothetical protein